MKSNKVFLLLIFSLFIICWIASLILHTDIDKSMNSFNIISILINPILGLLIMFYTLRKEDFRTLLFLYLTLWLIFGILLLISVITPVVTFRNRHYHTINLSSYFSGFTFIFTPLPFVFYWIFIKATKEIK